MGSEVQEKTLPVVESKNALATFGGQLDSFASGLLENLKNVVRNGNESVDIASGGVDNLGGLAEYIQLYNLFTGAGDNVNGPNIYSYVANHPELLNPLKRFANSDYYSTTTNMNAKNMGIYLASIASGVEQMQDGGEYYGYKLVDKNADGKLEIDATSGAGLLGVTDVAAVLKYYRFTPAGYAMNNSTNTTATNEQVSAAIAQAESGSTDLTAKPVV